MPTITSQQRFDDVGEADEDGYVAYAYHGFNYDVEVEGKQYKVRTYDDEPGVATVIAPSNARRIPETVELLSFLKESLQCSRFMLYGGTPRGGYNEVDPRTLEVLERGT